MDISGIKTGEPQGVLGKEPLHIRYSPKEFAIPLRRCIMGLLYASLLCTCHAQPEDAYLRIPYHVGYEREELFLKSLLRDKKISLESLGIRLILGESPAEAPRSTLEPAISIGFFRAWEYEAPLEGSLLISRTYFVPREDALAGRRDTTLAACLSGGETLIPIRDLAPPFIALRVNGLSLGEPGYPLVQLLGIRIEGELSSNNRIKESRRVALQRKIQGLTALLEAVPKPLITESPEVLWIASGGDLMLGRGAEGLLLKEGARGIFKDTANLLLNTDLTLVNLEGAVSSRGTKTQKSFNFRFDPRVAPALRTAGIDGVLLANNHTFDYGAEAFLDSLNYLEKAGIQVLGAGLDEEAAARPFVYIKGSNSAQVFGIASFPREKNGWDGLRVAAAEGKPGILHAGRGGGELLKKRFSQDDRTLDIVLFHGGDEWSTRPNSATRELYRDLVQHGADLIIGSHPHLVQGFEWVLGKAVFWSLGNYVFGGMDNTGGGDEGLFIRLGYIGTKLVYLEPYALSLRHVQTSIAPMEKLEGFYQLSRELRDPPPR